MNAPCPTCGYQRTSEGPCPRCLLRFATEEDAEAPGSTRYGGHVLGERIGRGGMGVIYRAQKPGQGREVALKTLVAGTEASAAELARFAAEIGAASTLDHPNLVPVYEVGATDGVPWFTMRLLEGGTLRARAKEFAEPSAAAKLVAVLARAVHHAHQRGVLHRDLKPENVLFDAAGVPAIADFGVARRLAEPGLTSSHALVGTPAYMAPEQARGGGALTVSVDVYALGAMLFELVTGRLPFEGPDTVALLRAIEEQPVPSAGSAVDRDLDAVISRCLAKRPSERYPTALALAEDLERWRAGLPVEARARSRAVRWALAHPLTSSIGVLGLGSLVAAALIGVSVARAQEAEVQQDALRTNAWTAEALAGAVLYQLQHAARVVEDEARSSGLIEVLASSRSPVEGKLGEVVQDVLARAQGEGVASVVLLDTAGVVLARAPVPPEGFIGGSLEQRDYVQRALRRGEDGRPGVTISRAFFSKVDGSLKIALSAPVFDAGRFVGLLVCTLTAGPSLGELRLGSDAHRRSLLVVPMEAPESRHAVFLADADVGRAPVLVAVPRLSELGTLSDAAPALSLPDGARRGEDASWVDPLTKEGPFLAGLAPVGRTGYVVVVQSRPADAVEGGRALARRLTLGVAAPVLLGLSLATLVGLVLRRRERA